MARLKIRHLLPLAIGCLPFIGGALFGSCAKEKAEAPNECGVPSDSIISFSVVIFPLVENHCAISSDCHGAGAQFQPVYDSYAAFRAKVDDGTLVNHLFELKDMPASFAPDSAFITDCERDLFRKWVDQGALNN